MGTTPTNEERSPEGLIGQARLIAEFHAVLAAHERRDMALGTLLLGGRKAGVNHIPGAEPGKIFHTRDLQERCVRYRLRLIDAASYRGVLPPRAVHALGRLEQRVGAPVRGLRILQADTGPVGVRLFAPMGGGRYYLVHEWGNAPGVWRRRLVWPLRGPKQAAITLAVFGLLLAAVLPNAWVGTVGEPHWGIQRLWVALWCELMVFGAAAFCWFGLRGRYNGEQWNVRSDR